MPNVNKVVVNGVTKLDLTADTVAANKMLSGTTAHDKSGAAITGSIASKAAQTYTPGSSAQTIAAGQYLSGAQTIAAVPTETKTATANGTVTPTSGKYLSSVTVAIPVYDGSVS